MPVLSVAEAAHRLGIDAKTLRRWLAEAQLPLQRHPGDGRKKGVSAEYVHLLARLHRRRLAGLAEESPAPAPALGEGLELSDVLLALPERLDAVQAQLSALEQQVAALTLLFRQPVSQPVSPPAAKPRRRSTRPPTPASATIKTPRKPVHVISRVEYGEQGQ